MKIGRLDCLDNFLQQSKVKKHRALKSTINSTFVPICFVAEVGILLSEPTRKKLRRTLSYIFSSRFGRLQSTSNRRNIDHMMRGNKEDQYAKRVGCFLVH